MMFDGQGHLEIDAAGLLTKVNADLRGAVRELAMSGTPRAFATFAEYRRFLDAVGEGLGVHSRSVVVRGSAHFGFSTSPKAGKVWNPFRFRAHGIDEPSDIDVAIVDVDYFNRMDSETREWEARQRRPGPAEGQARHWLRRENLRARNTCADDVLPPNTCMPHRNKMQTFDTGPFCQGVRRKVSAWVFRDWWSLQQKCEFDLSELARSVAKGTLPPPQAVAAPASGRAQTY